MSVLYINFDNLRSELITIWSSVHIINCLPDKTAFVSSVLKALKKKALVKGQFKVKGQSLNIYIFFI